MVHKTFPKLYKLTSAGKLQTWEVQTYDNDIVTRWGYKGGVIQETRDSVKAGKNTGRSNATTPTSQAQAEAQSLWDKKRKKGYCLSAEAANTEDNAAITGGVWPMLAHRFDKYANKITWPAFAQPKLDGHRCIAITDSSGECTLWSRTRKPIHSLPHIQAAYAALKLPNHCFDGELYNHDYRDNFEHLTHFIKRDTPANGCEVVQHHVYDMAEAKLPYWRRRALVDSVLSSASGRLVAVETVGVEDAESAKAAFDYFTSQGYEGAMLRNYEGEYIFSPSRRSYDLQKIKTFEDAEFKIIGVSEGRGKLQGHGIFTCVTDAGGEFDVKMAGDTETLKHYLLQPERYIGKMLTVQYQGFTKKSNLPRFPVALRIRNDV